MRGDGVAAVALKAPIAGILARGSAHVFQKLVACEGHV